MKRHLEYPKCSLYRYLANTAKKYPDYDAINYYGKKLTYRRLIGEISRTARALTAAGVRKGDSVSVCLPNIPQAIFLFYAINKVGAVANMIHPMSAENEMIRYMELTESRYIFFLDSIADKVRKVCLKVCPEKAVAVNVSAYMPPQVQVGYFAKLKGKLPEITGFDSWSDFISGAKGITYNINAEVKPDDTAAILYSGGTTGVPKGIMLTNLNFNALADQSIDGTGTLYAGERMLSIMPIFHGFGLGVCIHTLLILGGTAIILPKFSAAEFHELLFKYKPNIISGVPAIYEAMLKNTDFAGKDMSFLKTVISGGDSLSASSKKKLNALLAEHGSTARVREGYGLTECVTGCCLLPEESDKLDSVGLPYADTYFKIVDTEGNELPAGETGEIILRGTTVMKGYYKAPEETANTLRMRDDGHIWLHTGDLGYMDEEGYVFFRQRLKRMIVSGGYNIYPQNIEEVINSHRDVVMCAVVGVPDRIMGEMARAYVVAKEGVNKDALRDELNDMLKREVAKYALPREIRFKDSLPKTLVGKVDYLALKAEE
ncbi:class I adenylate-forming enzyme family protein [uncultured Ruminococcus sp.]|uniref:class I adenylate-forming enzyme family protein n=1 Tax=uncultured Ruminococcus sp. TaxID=165186 RepID=UPI0025FB97DA|nr:AMP-binding protein [uncultured Ruminococcus sp.]